MLCPKQTWKPKAIWPSTLTSKLKKTTLGELGPNLPIGIVGPDKELYKQLAHNEWTTRKEREIGKSKKKNMNQCDHVSLILQSLYRQVGNESWAPDDVDPR